MGALVCIITRALPMRTVANIFTTWLAIIMRLFNLIRVSFEPSMDDDSRIATISSKRVGHSAGKSIRAILEMR